MNKIRSLIVSLLSATIGEMLVVLRPEKAKKLSEKGMTVSIGDNGLSISERLMRRAILKKVENRGSLDKLAEFHQNYWTNKGADFFAANNMRLEHVHLPFCDFIFDHLQEKLSTQPEKYNTLVEIGTGNGIVLDYLSSRFLEIERFIGIDLNEKQTKINQEHYKNNPKLEFVASDAFDWVNENGQENTVFITFMGVLEYFTEQRLYAFLRKLNSLGKIIFVAIEPNGIDHDFAKNPNSQVYGPERSFSHNYPRLFKTSGFELWHSSKKELEGNSDYISFLGAINH